MAAQITARTNRRTRISGDRLTAAAAVLFGTFLMGLGTTWDISWHTTVGRDTFWIPPHLAIYGGTVLTIVALVNAWVREVTRRRLPGEDGELRMARWGIAPGVVVSTIGGLWFLASGPFDDLWHRRYGLDVTLWSPPHVSLMAAGGTMVLGAVMLVAAERRRLDRVAPDRPLMQCALELGLLVLGLGFLLQPATLAMAPGIRYSYLQPGPLGAWLLPLLIVSIVPAIVFTAPAFLRAPAGLTAPVLVQVVMRPIGAGFATLGYALIFPGGVPADNSILDFPGGSALFGLTVVPMLLLAPAVLADLTLVAARSFRRAWVLAALVFGLVVAIEGVFGPTVVGRTARPLPEAVAFAPALALAAVASAALGRGLASVGTPGARHLTAPK